MDIEKKIEDLSKDIVELKIDKTALVAQMSAISDTLHSEMKHIRELIEKAVIPKIENVEEQARKTNGRVNKLEDTTKIASVVFNNPFIFKLVTLGSLVLGATSLMGVIVLILKMTNLDV